MAKLNIIYWSGTGNTEKMGELIKEGALGSGADVELIDVTTADSGALDTEILALGSPSMGAEEIESEMEDFISSNSDKLSGKRVGLFGSYDWGDGEWMREWKDTISSYGAEVVGDGCIVQLTPEGESAEQCKLYGKSLVEGR